MANTKLTRSPSGSSNRKTMTWSWWIKRSKLSSAQYIYNQYNSADNYNSGVLFQSDDTIRFWDYGGSSNDLDLRTNRKFRDTNGFYNIVLAIDTTQATASNRIKLYVNGVQETSFSTATYPNQNHQLRMNEYQVQQIGVQGYGSTYQSYFDGVMSHVNFIDGTTYTPSAFGETDATTGEWKIKTSPSVTYGTNGFFILKDGNSVTDQSGKGNNFTVGGGTLTKTEDCPSNVFATYNPLCVQVGNANEPIFGNGNTSILGSSSGAIKFHAPSTLGASSGKWYVEFKGLSSSNENGSIGVTYDPSEDARNDKYPGAASYSWGYYVNGNYYNNDNASSYGNAWNTDIIGVALDLDNSKLYFSKNGTWQNSGDPTSGSTGTGAISITADKEYFFATGDGNTTYINPFDANFGNGYFGTTAVSSAGTNASGNGIFEYDVPSGYTALSTKGLNL